MRSAKGTEIAITRPMVDAARKKAAKEKERWQMIAKGEGQYEVSNPKGKVLTFSDRTQAETFIERRQYQAALRAAMRFLE